MFTLAAIKAVLGPVVALLGAAWQARETRLTKEIEFKERALERDHELKIGMQEAENAMKKVVIESDAAIKLSEMAAFNTSQTSIKPMLQEGTKLTGWHKTIAVLSDVMTSSIRPFMTVYYQLFVLGIFIWVIILLNKLTIDVIDANFAQELVKEIIYSVLMLAETTLLWFFGIRMLSVKGKKHN